jgi:hypothetical protein
MKGNAEGARVAGQTEFSLQSMVLGEGSAMGAIKPYTSAAQIRDKTERRIYSTAITEARSRIIVAENKGPISPSAKLQITREVMADIAQREGKAVTMPTALTAPTPIVAGNEAQFESQVSSWSAFIAQQGGGPSLAKIARLQQVSRVYQPPAYTDADRQAQMIRIAREP